MSPVNTELSGFTVRAGRGFSGSDSDAGLSSLVAVIAHSYLLTYLFIYLFVYFYKTSNTVIIFKPFRF